MSKVQPLHIIFGLLGLVVAANIVFVYFAVTRADSVVPSYATEPR
jgi:hypothetical protein